MDSNESEQNSDQQSVGSMSESSQSSDNSSCNGRLIQVEGDVQPSSSSHVSESYVENRNFPPASRTDRQSSLDDYFVTPKLDFEYEDSNDFEENSCEVQISMDSLKPDARQDSASLVSTDSKSTIDKEKNISFLSEDSSSVEDSYFETASYESGSSTPSRTSARKRVGGSTNDVANRTTCAQVEPSRASTNSSEVTVNVFLTYALEPSMPGHVRAIASMAETYHKLKYTHTGPDGKTSYELNFTADVYDKNMVSVSKSHWLDNQIKKADFVLVCVSPSYSSMVEDKTVQKDINETSYDNTVHTQYIYTRIHSEYINNSSKNDRFIPVLFSGATRDNVPSWLRDTLIYRWSEDHKALLFRLIRKEEHMKPAPGPLPVLQMKPRFQDCGVAAKRRT